MERSTKIGRFKKADFFSDEIGHSSFRRYIFGRRGPKFGPQGEVEGGPEPEGGPQRFPLRNG